ncbi:hypothetical protein OK024_13815 [Acinetobacter sp. UGAL515B_02]|nr:hypothetical protein [Acinetobacter sp. UGAL515B_02]WON81715.1 hypothetical protein OK024_13815 [Acinetobacter sp. UGAL515B_02]
MACGCVPLCTDHNGPKIILGNNALNKIFFLKIILWMELLEL